MKGRRLRSKRIVRLRAHKVTAIAQHRFRFEGQLPQQCPTESYSGSRLSNDKRARGPYIHNVIVAQIVCQHATERLVRTHLVGITSTSEKQKWRHASRSLLCGAQPGCKMDERSGGVRSQP